MTSSRVNTLCAYCGVGCGMVLEVTRESPDAHPVITKTIGRKDHPTNFGRLCTKGSTTVDLLAASGRMEKASLRRNRDEQRESVDVSVAVDYAAQRMRAIADEHGPDSVALYVSGQMSLESQYLTNKLAKGFLRTTHIESNSRLCMASAGTGYKQSLGADGPPGSYQDFDHADLFLVIGSNMADCHPILFLRMMERVKAGATLIVVDPRRTATAAKADLFLQITPGTDLALLNGLLYLLLESGCVDQDFIAAHTEGWEQMPEFLADYTPAEVARITGLSEADIRRTADLIGAADNWMSCWTMGLNQSIHGTWHTNAICNLHLATGAICRIGSGPFSLTGQPNAMGGREMGYMGPGLPGQRSVISAEDRRFVEDRWGLPPESIRSDVGPGTIAMFDDMREGRIRACWIICTNPVASVANRSTVIEALRRCDLVIVQDVFADNETMDFADVALPATLWTESDGVMVNSERNLTLFERAVDPPGDALPDWDLIARISARMGYADAFDYSSAEQIFDEIREFWNPATGYDLRGASYDRLRRTPLQWPCPPDDDADRHPVRYLNDGVSQRIRTAEDGTRPALAFATPSGRAVFHARPALPQDELPDDAFPFVLNTGRLAHQWHTMTKTARVAKLMKLNPDPFVEIHPADAQSRGITAGDRVCVASRRGSAILPAVVTERVRVGNCFAPFHWSDMFGEDLAINAVTNDAVDPMSLQPEFKACAVSLTRVDAAPSVPRTIDGADRGLAAALGISAVEPPTPDAGEQRYLAGLLAGLASDTARPGTPVLPPDAPVRADVAQWVNGVLAGAFSRASGAVPGDGTEAPATTVEVLWASQTGTVEDYAPTVVDRLRTNGIAARTRALDAVDAEALRTAGTALMLTSTTGDGDPPDNAAELWEALSGDDAPSLDGLRYAVLAFGDPSYDEFCGFGRKLDARLTELGATRLLDRVDCEPDFTLTAAQWLTSVSDLLGEAGTTGPVDAGVDEVPAPRSIGRSNPLSTRLIGNERLNGDGSVKDVRRFTFALPADALTYDVGDSLGVWPRNSPPAVDAFLSATGLTPEEIVDLGGESLTLQEALRDRLEIAKVTPAVLQFVCAHTTDGADELRSMLLPDNTSALDDWLWGRQIADVVAHHPVAASAAEWLSVLAPLAPRQYSISSSPLENPAEVQLTVSAVRYNVHGTPRHGVCSTYLADHAADDDIRIWVQRAAHFAPPDDPDTPMIMVGPGTGIAPFRGFLQHRRALGHRAPNWLFFGEQHAATDFYYRDELSAMLADGSLTRLDVAFSRDQSSKVYVQDRMIEHGREIWRWLSDGAHFYVCGDRTRMARDVDDALTRIVAEHGKLSGPSAESYVKALAAEKRYVRDVY